MENVIFKYSDFFEDDGGMARVKSEFVKLGDELIAEAKRVKSELNKNLSFDNPESASAYEKQVEKMVEVNKQYEKSLKDLNAVAESHQKEIKEAIAVEIALEKAKQESIKTTRQEIQAEGDLAKAITAENNSIKSGIALQEAQRRQREASEKSIKKEQDAYGRLSAELNTLFRATASLAVEMYELEQAGLKTSPAYARLESQFNTFQARTTKLDGALKTIDASLGRHQRKVGEYERGYSGLNNAVGQIARELPAFTFSLQTGLLGVSNNIPILVDEINRLKVANADLLKQGKPTQSILQGLVGAVFSWNTAISIGIFLITKYAKEIQEWTMALLGGSSALDELNDRQKEYNNQKLEGRKNAQGDIIELRKYLAVVKDQKVSDEERNIALKALRDQYPFYFKNLTDAQILAGKSIIAEMELTKALEKRKEIEKKTELNVTNKQKLIDIDLEIEKERELLENRRANFKELSSIQGINPNITLQASKRLRESELILNKLLKERTAINNISLKNDRDIFKLKKETIALEYKEEKQRKDKEKQLQQINSVDYLANEFELKKKVLENNIKINEEIFNSDKYTAETRVEAQKQMASEMVALAELERNEHLRVLKNAYKKESTEMLKDSEGKKTIHKYTAKGLLELEKQYGFNKEIIQKEYNEKLRQAQEKAEGAFYLETRQRQIDNLKYLQKTLSMNADVYKAYSRQISIIQEDINNVTDLSKVLDARDKLLMSSDELKRTEQLTKDLDNELEKRGALNLRQLEKFQKRQEHIQKNSETQRKLQRTYAIAEEQKSFEKGTTQFVALETERQNILTSLENDAIKERLQNQKDNYEQWKAFADDLNQLIEKVLDRMMEITQRRVDQETQAVESQKKSLETQERRAELGLENTLALEQKALAERESMLIKQQKKEERLRKIQSLWTSYSSYADKDPDTAIAKALRDFAILETISATFGDGGIPNDKLPADGIFRGQSHKGNNGGIPILVEGREGIFSAREMDNLGKDNFYKMKDIAGQGKVDSNFFSRQRKQFTSIQRRSPKQHNSEDGWKKVREAIENKPVPNYEVARIANGTMELVETILTKNGAKRNHYKTKKPRL